MFDLWNQRIGILDRTNYLNLLIMMARGLGPRHIASQIINVINSFRTTMQLCLNSIYFPCSSYILSDPMCWGKSCQ